MQKKKKDLTIADFIAAHAPKKQVEVPAVTDHNKSSMLPEINSFMNSSFEVKNNHQSTGIIPTNRLKNIYLPKGANTSHHSPYNNV